MENVSSTMRNTGRRTGAEIKEVHVGLPASANEPPKRLVAWEKVRLAPGESKTVTLRLDPTFLSVINEQRLPRGECRFRAGGHSGTRRSLRRWSAEELATATA